MAGIQDFISLASKKLGIGEEQARSATGGLLGAIQGGAAPADFKNLLGAIPGAAGLVGKQATPVEPVAPKAGGIGGALGSLAAAAQGGLGSVAGAVGGVVGGKAGGSLELIGAMQSAGLTPSKGKEFVTLFLGFAKDKAGPGVVSGLTSKMPELAKFVS